MAMMKARKKMALKKETLRKLDEVELVAVRGGAYGTTACGVGSGSGGCGTTTTWQLTDAPLFP
jgi:natural product precursor